jgi:hypothetical protein
MRPAAIRQDYRAHTNNVMYFTAMAICVAVTSINYGSGWIWASDALDRALTHGIFLDDPSRFDRVAVVLAQGFLAVGLLSLAVYQWKMVGSRWWQAWRSLRLLNGGLKTGDAEKLKMASLPFAAGKGPLLDGSGA